MVAADTIDPPAPASIGDPGLWVDAHGDALFRYAMSRIGDRALAEDLVQETFLAALQGQDSFRGASAPRTWLIAVLRNKMVDHLRRAGRIESLQSPDTLDGDGESVFNERGRWIQKPEPWDPGLPDGAVERREFWQTLARCVEGVPGRAGEAFTLRVLCDLPAEDVQEVLSVKSNNLWTMLHRARRGLRSCLERTWFGKRSKGGA